ncbi:MAG: MBOAT family protein, partial [Oscillibacter sp.]|nr:MBOAT family protein [Oscillibacter sp.]
FVSFFPQLVQGPISRYGDLSRTLHGEHPWDSRTVCRGLQRMLWGYFKKLVVADRLLTAVSTLTSDPSVYGGAWAAAALLLYTVELYADFTGGIDVTIGLAEALGITVAENFNRPYFSKSLKEYWRRWHISMASWFRDYVFYPVSTSKWMQRFTKFSRARLGDRAGRRLPVYVSSFLVWLATGVWHGASWNFIVWGLLNWAVLMASEECEPLYAKFHARFHLEGRTGWKVFQIARTFALICVLNLFDCYVHVGDTLRSLLSVFTVHNWHILTDGALLSLGLSGADYGAAAFGCALMLAVSLKQRRGSVRDQIAVRPYAVRFVIWYGLFLLTLLLGAYGFGYDASQFIYNRF